MERNQDSLAHHGLTLPGNVLRRLNKVGIFAQSHVSLEHQNLGGKYVVRGIESGGAVREIGRYVTFCGPDGERLPYLHPIDTIAVNGVHAVVIAPVLVRIELFRTGRTYQLLITKHQPGQIENGRRPRLENSVLFRGVNGFLDAEQPGKERHLTGSTMARFWSRGGEGREIPSLFATAVQAAIEGASCIGCAHMHYLVGPAAIMAVRGSA